MTWPAEKADTPRSNENRSHPGGAAAPRRSCSAGGRSLLLVPLLALVLVACGWRPASSEAVALPVASSDEPEAAVLPSTVAALRQLARARGLITAGSRRVSQARKANLLVALA